jgi:hypothetical protein
VPNLHFSALLGKQPSTATNSAAAAAGGEAMGWTNPPYHTILGEVGGNEISGSVIGGSVIGGSEVNYDKRLFGR